MIPHPSTGDVSTITNSTAVRLSVLHILKLKPFEIPGQANLLGLEGLLFITRDHIVDAEIKTRIEYTLEKFEKRIKVKSINLDSNGPQTLIINIVYNIVDLNVEDQISYVIKRTN